MNEADKTKFEGYISLSEASKQTGYHQDYLGYLCRVGKLKGFKIGRNWVTTQGSLDELMGSHTEEAPKAVLTKHSSFETKAASSVVVPSNENLYNLKAEVLDNIETRVKNIALNVERLENSILYNSTVIPEKLSHDVIAPKTNDLKNTFIPAIEVSASNQSKGEETPVSAALNLEKVYGSFKAKPVSNFSFSSVFSYAVAFVFLGVLLIGGILQTVNNPSYGLKEVVYKKLSEEKNSPEVFSGSKPSKVSLGNVNSLSSNKDSKVLSTDANLLYSLIDERLNQYLAEGKFKGEKGETGLQGPQGVPGQSAGWSVGYVQPAPSVSSNSVGSVGAITNFSSNSIVTKDLSVTGYATINNLSVTSLALGFTSGSVVFQGASGLTEDNSNFFWNDSSNQLSIGTTTADASAVLQLESNSKGFLAPRMTTSERDSIVAPANGLLVYNITTAAYNFYNGTSWSAVGTGSGGSGGVVTGIPGSFAFYSATEATVSPQSVLFVSGSNIGVGTSTPSSRFTLVASSTIQNIFTIASSSGSSLAVFDQNGKLGLGTSSPRSALDVVSGDIYVGETGLTNNPQLSLSDQGIYARIQSFNGPLALNSLGANVGIGTSTPQQTLDIQGTLRLTTGDIYAPDNSGVRIRMHNGGVNTYGDFVFASLSSSTLAVVTNSGNFGVGTSTPSQRFVVAGNALFTGSTTIASLGTGLVRSSNGSLYTDSNVYLTQSATDLLYPSFAYASSTFGTYTYNSSTFATLLNTPSYAYGSSTYVSYPYASSTFATISSLLSYPTFSYGSSTYVSYSYGSSTYATQAALLSYPTFAYASTTFGSFFYNSSTFATLANTPSYTYASNTFSTYTYNSSTFPSFAYGSSTYALSSNFTGTNGFVARWSSATGLTAGKLIDNGSVVGVNATSSSYTFNLQGTSGVSPLNIASSTGTSLLVIDQAGNVAIGASSALGYKLYVNGTAAFPGQIRFTDLTDNGLSNGITANVSGSTGVGFTVKNRDTTGTAFRVQDTNSYNLFNVQTLGNVGINTSSPIATLAITGSSSNNSLYIASSSGAAQLVVAPSGNVGVGTATPGSALTVAGSGLFTGGNITLGVTNSVGGQIVLRDANTVNSGVISFVSNNMLVTPGNNGDTYLQTGIGGNALTVSGAGGNLGNIGIWNTFPSYMLDVSPTVARSGNLFRVATSTGAGLYVINNGNVGINTSTPGAKLEINAGTSDGILLGNSNDLMWRDSTGVARAVLQLHSDNRTYLDGQSGIAIRPAGSQELVTINTSGNVGIGVTGPGDKLEVAGNVFASAFNSTSTVARYSPNGGVFMAGNGGSSYAEIRAYADIAGTGKILSLNSNGGNVGIGTISPASTLYVQGTGLVNPFVVASSSGAALMTVAPTGNVGIGTSSPAALFSLLGNSNSTVNALSRIQNNYSSSYIPLQEMLAPNMANGQSAYFALGQDASNYNRAAWSFYRVGSNSTSNYMAFGFFGADNLFNIQATGNVGVGTTSPIEKFSVAGNGYFSGNVGIGAAADTALRVNGNVMAIGYGLGAPGASNTVLTNSGGQIQLGNTASFSSTALFSGTTQALTVSGGNTSIAGNLSVTGSLTLASATTTINGITYYWPNNLPSGNRILQSDSSGNLAWVTDQTGAGGTLAGGVNGYVTVWTGTTSVATGVLIDNAAVAGVNATSSTISFNVQGNGSRDPFNVSSSTGTSLLKVSSTGNVGIGTATPTSKFVVQGGSFEQWIDNATNYRAEQINPGVIGLLGNRNDYFLTYDVENIRVGVGTTSPYAKLSVTNNSATPSFVVEDSYLDTTPFIIDAVGNVGIGTTSPSAKLYISDSSGGPSIIINDPSSSVIPSIEFQQGGTTKAKIEAGVGLSNGLFFDYGTTRLMSFGYNNNPGVAIGRSYVTNSTMPSDGLIVQGSVGVGTSSPFATLAVTGSSSNNSLFVASSSGAVQLVVAPSGNVGIGTSSPTKRLEVADGGGVRISTTDGNSAYLYLSQGGTGTVNLYNPSGSTLWISNGGSARLGFDTTGLISNGDNNYDLGQSSARLRDLWLGRNALIGGNVGIGTTSPAYQLTLEKNNSSSGFGDNPVLSIQNPSTAGGASSAIRWEVNGSEVGIIDSRIASGVSELRIGVNNGSSREQIITVREGGNVGIGTTTPTTRLHVKGAVNGDEDLLTLESVATGGGADSGILFTSGGSPYNVAAVRGTTDSIVPGGRNLTFWGINGAGSNSLVERMRINSDGNVGIGTTTPNSRLTITSSGTVNPFVISSSSGITLASVDALGNFNLATLTASSLVMSDAGKNLSSVTLGSGLSLAGGTLSVTSSAVANAAWTIGSGLIYNATSTDLVGIGTTAPTTSLFVQGKGGTNPFAIASSTGSQLFTVTQSGNVGVGTSSPVNKFVVSGGKTIVDSTDLSWGQVQIGNSNNAGAAIAYLSGVTGYGVAPTVGGSGAAWLAGLGAGSAANTDFSFYGGSANRLTIQSGGNVGVGTTTPIAPLQVYNSSQLTSIFQSSGSNIAKIRLQSTDRSVDISNGSTGGNYISVLGGYEVWSNGSGSSNNSIKFYNSNAATLYGGLGVDVNSNIVLTQASSTQAIVLTGGNVGINTSSPIATLAVTGSSSNNSLFIASSSGAAQLVVAPSGNVGIGSALPGAKLEVNGGVNLTSGTSVINSTNGNLQLVASSGGQVQLVNNSTAALTASGGNVGIGTTTPATALVVGSGQITVPNGTAGAPSYSFITSPSTGMYWDGSSLNYSVTGTRRAYLNASQFAAFDNLIVNGASGNVTTVGNVGIGTTNPQYGKLQVQSTVGTDSFIAIGQDSYRKWQVGLLGGSDAFRIVDGDAPYGTPFTIEAGSPRNLMYLDNTAAVGINVANPTASLFVQGTSSQPTMDVFVAASSTGTQLLTVKSNGNVGIGTSTPNAKLSVVGSIFTSDHLTVRAQSDTNNNSLYYAVGTDSLNLVGNLPTGGGNRRVYVYDDLLVPQGNVGINTTTPGRTLTVAGDIRATGILYDSSNSAGTSGQFLMTTGTGYAWTSTSTLFGGSSITGSGTNGYVTRFTAANTLSTGILLDNGTVSGVNATSSSYAFNIQAGPTTAPLNVASSNGASLLSINGAGVVNIPGSVDFSQAAGIGSPSIKFNGSSSYSISANNTAEYIQITGGSNYLNVNNYSVYTNANVGIGTTTPNTALSVQGAAGAIGTFNVSGATDGRIEFRRMGSRQGLIGWDTGVFSLEADSLNSADLALKTGGSNRLYITTLGNVGIGTSSPVAKLDVYGNLNVGTSSTPVLNVNTATMQVGINGTNSANALSVYGPNTAGLFSLYNSSDSNRQMFSFTTASNNARMLMYDSSSSLAVQIQAGNGPTFFNGGNVGINTTTPGRTLTVVGDIRATGILYDSSNSAGTSGQFLMSTASGYAWTSTSTLFGGSSITGSGTNGFVTRFTAGNTLSTGILLDSGTRVGVNATSSSYTFNVQGSSGVNPFNITSSTGTSLFTVTQNGNVGIGTTTPTALLSLAQGTTAAFGINFGGDVDLYRSAAHMLQLDDKLRISVGSQAAFEVVSGGISYFTVDTTNGRSYFANGNVGIGTTTPGATFVVQGSGLTYVNTNLNAATSTISFGGGNNNRPVFSMGPAGTSDEFKLWNLGYYQMGPTNSQGFSLMTNATDRLYVKSDGNVGIGTTNPISLLNLYGSSQTLTFQNPTTGGNITDGYYLGLGASSGDMYLWNRESGSVFFGQNNGTVMTLANSNVGIGTTTPTNKLHINSATALRLTNGVPGIEFLQANPTTWGLYAVGGNTNFSIISQNVGIGTTTPTASLFVQGVGQTNPFVIASSTGANILTVLPSGNVGVGVSSPSYKLQVAGGIKLSSESSVAIDVPSSSALRNNGVGGAFYMDVGTLYVRDGNGSNSNAGLRLSGGASIGNGYTATTPPTNGAIIEGNVGIGTTSPVAKLDVYGNLNVATGTTPALFVDTTTGRVGIGKNNPTQTLDVYGSVNVNSAIYYAAGNGILNLSTLSVNSASGFDLRNSNAAGYLALSPGNSEVVRLTSSGNVGIGTTTPNSRLTITSSGTVNPFVISSSSGITLASVDALGNFNLATLTASSLVMSDANKNLSSVTLGSGLSLAGGTLSVTSSAGANAAWTIGSGLIYNATSTDLVGIGTTAPTTSLFVQGKGGTNPFAIASSTGTQMVTVTQSGNLGIGVTNPTQALVVKVTGTSVTSENQIVVLSNTDTGTNGLILGKNNSAQSVNGYHGPDYAHLINYANAPLILGTNNTAQLTITGSGNVGIGTTSPAQKLQLENSGGAAIRIQRNDSALANGGIEFTGNDGVVDSSIYYNNLIGSSLTFNTGGGTSANIRMTVDGSGNVGIGTTTPGQKLEVAGNVLLSNGAAFMQRNAAGTGYIYPASVTVIDGVDYGYNSGSAGLQFYNGASVSAVIKGGNLGIGTTSPAAQLFVQGAAGNNIPFSVATSTGGVVAQVGVDGSFNASRSINLYTTTVGNGTPIFTATQNNTDAVSITSPNFGSANNVLKLTMGNAANIGMTIQGASGQSGDYMNITSNGGSAGNIFTVESSGNVGVGVTNPTHLFEVGGIAYVSGSVLTGGVNPLNSGVQLTVGNGSATSLIFDKTVVSGGTGNAWFTGGNLGIGTTTPGQLLSVAGNMRLTGALFDGANASGTVGMVLQTTGTSTQWVATSTLGIVSNGVSGGTPGFVARFTSASALSTGILLDNGTRAGVNATSSSYTFNIQGSSGVSPLNIASSTGTSMLVVSQAGNVGVGTTGPSEKMHVIGNLRVQDDYQIVGSDNSTVVGTIAYGGGGNGVGLYEGGTIKIDLDPSATYIQNANLDVGGGDLFVNVTSGNVGIGTTAPTTTLFVQGLGGTNPFAIASSTGSQLFTVTQSGNVGVGTSAPETRLHITDSLSSGNLVMYLQNTFSTYGGQRTYVGPDAELSIISQGVSITSNLQPLNALSSFTGTTDHAGRAGMFVALGGGKYSIQSVPAGTGKVSLVRFAIDTNGNVGIGTSAPIATLFVQGSSSAPTTNPFVVASSTGTQLLTVIPSGNVGIGTMSPSVKLQVITATSSAARFASTYTHTNGQVGEILQSVIDVHEDGSFPNTASNRLGFRIRWQGVTESLISAIDARHNVSWGGGLVFLTKSSDGSSTGPLYERMVINNNGNVGIGTNAPSATLFVQGTTTINPFVVASSSGTQLLTVLPNGNIGVGVSSPSQKLEVNGNIRIPGSDNYLQFGTGNMKVQGSNSGGNMEIYLGSAVAVSGSNGAALRFWNNAGNSIIGELDNYGSMKLGGALLVSTTTASSYFAGNLGIGTTTPAQTLSVAGNMRLTGALFDGANASGTVGMILQTTGTSTQWVATSTLGFASSGVSGGINGYIARFTSASTLSTGLLLDSGSRAGINATSSSFTFNLQGSSGVSPFQIASSTGTSLVVVDQRGYVGIGTSSPSSLLSVAGEVLGQYFTAYATNSTTTLAGGLNVNNGAITHDWSSGVTSIDNLQLGSLNFDTNAGQVSWVDMPVTASSATSTINSYTAQLDGSALFTVYGESDGSGGIQNSGVGVGTSTPIARFSVQGASDANALIDFASSSGASVLRVTTAGNLGLGTTTPIAKLSVVGTAGNNAIFDLASSTGSSVLRVTAAGNVGIGTASPISTFAVVNSGVSMTFPYTAAGGNVGIELSANTSGHSPALSLRGTNTNGRTFRIASWQDGTTGKLVVRDDTASVDRVTIDASGNFGIGTANPTSILHIASTSPTFTIERTGISNITLSNSGSTWTWGTSAATANHLAFAPAGAEAMRIQNGGNVGIGTTTPGYLLSVNNGSVAEYPLNLTSSGKFVRIGALNSTYAHVDTDANAGFYFYDAVTAGGGNAVLTSGNSYLLSGNFGIGTSSPIYKLHVTASSAGNEGLILENQSTGPIETKYYNSTWGSGGYFSVGQDSTGGFLYSQANAPIRIFTNGVNERMRITGEGNVGIGTSTPNTKLVIAASINQGVLIQADNEVGTQLTIRGATNPNNNLYIGYNTTGDYGFIQAITQGASQRPIILGSGGNVGINTTTPGQLLSVAGNMRLTGALFDGANASGTVGMVLQTTGTSTQWVATSTLGIVSNGVSGGTPGFVARFTSASALSTGLLLDNGTVSGVNATSSSYTFNLQGSSGVSPFQITSSTGTSLLLVNQAGNMGIGGMTTVGKKFEVLGDLVSRMSTSTGAAASFVADGFGANIWAHSAYNPANPGSGWARVLTASSTGNVGIGTTTPLSQLHVQGSGSSAYITLTPTIAGSEGIRLTNESGSTRAVFESYNATGEVRMGSAWSSYFPTIYTGGYEIMRFTTGGNVGIGTSVPTATLFIQGTSSAPTVNPFAVASSSGSQLVTVTPSGSLGIGNSNPFDKLVVAGDVNIQSPGQTVAGRATLWLGATPSSYDNSFVTDNTTGQLDFMKDNGIGSPSLTILQSGNIGINTTTPSATLLVNGIAGSINPLVVSSSTGTTLFRVAANGTTTISNLGTGCVGVSSGQLYTTTCGAGGTGSISTSTTAQIGKLPVWTGSATLGNSSFLDNGTVAGVNATSSSFAFNIQGTGSLHPLQVGTSTNASMLVVRGDSGNVGIGTSSPLFKLDVQGQIAAQSVLNIRNTGVGQGIIATDSYPAGTEMFSLTRGDAVSVNNTKLKVYNDLSIATNNSDSEKFRVTAGGNVGIGTSTPGNTLVVAGSIDTTSTYKINNTIRMLASGNYTELQDGSSNTRLHLGNANDPTNYYSNNLHVFRNGSASTEYMRITSVGNVGVGTSGPTSLLHVAGTSPTLKIDRLSGTADQQIVFSQANVLQGIVGIAGAANGIVNGTVSGDMGVQVLAGKKILFSTDNGGTSTLTINNNNVGIGTTAPTSTFAIAGSGSFNPFTIASSSGAIMFRIDARGNMLQGSGSINSGASGSLAIGNNATISSSGTDNAAIGYGTTISQGYRNLAMQGASIPSNVAYSMAIGNGSSIQGDGTSYAIAIGTGDTSGSVTTAQVNNEYGLAIGTYVTSNANSAYVFGRGNTGTNRLINSVAGSMMFGMNTASTTLFISQGYTANTTGSVAINTTTTASLFTIQSFSTTTLPILTIASSTGKSLVWVSAFGGFVQNISSSTAINIMDGAASPSSVFVVDTTNSSGNAGLDITAGGAQSGNLLNFYSSGGSIMLGVSSVGGIVQNVASTTALQLLNGSGSLAFNFDTVNKKLGIGTSTGMSALDIISDISITESSNPSTGSGTATGLRVLTSDSDSPSVLIRNTSPVPCVGQGSGCNSAVAAGSAGILTLEAATSSNTSWFNFITAFSGTTRSAGNAVFRVRGDGNVYGEAAFNASGADYAEYFDTLDTSIEPGDIVVATTTDEKVLAAALTDAGLSSSSTSSIISSLSLTSTTSTSSVNSFAEDAKLVSAIMKSQKAYDSKILGIVSNQAAFIGNNPGGRNDSNKFKKAVGLVGRVPVKATNENGQIKTGDYVTTSGQFGGYAMKATRSGHVLGIALEDFRPFASSTSNSTGPVGGTVLVFIQPGWQNIGNQFVIGDGELTGQLASGTASSFLIDQKGTGNLLQIQKGGMDKFVINNDGVMKILSTSSTVTELFVVENSGEKVFSINSKGELYAKGHLKIGKDTSGTAVIKPGDNQTTVTFEYPYSSVPKVVVTMQGMPNFFYGVTQKSETSFTITMSQPASEEVKFDWIAVEQADETNSVSSNNSVQDLQVNSSPSNPSTSSGSAMDLSNGEVPENDIPVGTQVGPSYSGNGEVAGESTSGESSSESQSEITVQPEPSPAVEIPPATEPVTDAGSTPTQP